MKVDRTLTKLSAWTTANSALTLLSTTVMVTLTISSTQPAFAANKGSIVINVDRLNNNKGVVRLALFNSKDSYKKDKNTWVGAYKTAVSKIENNHSTCAIKDVPYGEYAIKLYHDEDNSGIYKKNFMRVPCVQFGFSNNAKAIFGPPRYAKAKFNLNSSKLEMNIRMDQR